MGKRDNNKKINVYCIAFCGILAAMTIALTRFCSVNIGSTYRIGIGRLPVVFASICFGPVYGVLVGAVADIVGALISTGWNPVITIPAALCGLLPWLFCKLFGFYKRPKKGIRPLLLLEGVINLSLLLSIGLLLSLILILFYDMGVAAGTFILIRCGICLIEGTIEAAFIYVLFQNMEIRKFLSKTGFYHNDD